MDVYARLKELNITLPEVPPKLGGINIPIVQVGNILFVSGHTPREKGIPVYVGKVGSERTLEEGIEAAKLCTLAALSNLNNFLGDLNKIKRVVKTLGFVQSADGFTQQPKVINGSSALLQDIWGENGVATRSSIGVNELPDGVSVEIEFIFEI